MSPGTPHPSEASSTKRGGSRIEGGGGMELPSGWEVSIDTSTGRTYYYNESTGETSWDFPSPWQEMQDQTSGQAYWFNTTTQETSWDAPLASASVVNVSLPSHRDVSLPSGWTQATNNEGKPYYFNSTTKETSWEIPSRDPPRKLASQMTDVKAAVTIQGLWRTRAARQRLHDMTMTAFEKVYDPTTGSTYYFNTRTGVSSWTKPRGMGKDDLDIDFSDLGDGQQPTHVSASGIVLPVEWEEAYDASTQRNYYYNTRTQDTSWTVPKLGPGWKPIMFTEEEAAIRIQGLWRTRIARRRVSKMMKTIYEIKRDPESGATYYFNTMTGESSWDKPKLFDAGDTQATGRRRSQMLQPAGDWQELYSDTDQRAFYFNAITGESVWEPPWDDDVLNSDFGSDEEDEEEEEEEEEEEVAERIQDNSTQTADEQAGNKSTARSFLSDSSAATAKIVRERKYPRSRGQKIVDDIEDDPATDFLNLKSLSSWKISSRVWDLEQLTELNISHNRIRRLGSDVSYLEDLTKLDISHNRLHTLPERMQNMTQLKNLNAAHNAIRGFAPHLWKLRAIHTLDLSHNMLEEFPKSTGDLELLKETSEWEVGIGLLSDSLTKLNVDHNRMTDWPFQLEQLTNLKELTLGNNQLAEVPATIREHVELEHLDLSNNVIEDLPEEINALEKLTEFTLQNNKLTELPDGLDDMKQLQLFNADGNSLQELPEEFGQLPSLTSLSLRSNDLLSVPASFGELINLKTLDLSHNHIVALPPELCGAKTLVELRLNHNKLNQFPVGMKRMGALTALNLSHNELKRLPSDIGGMDALRLLDLSHNKILDLPFEMADAAELTSLNLGHNKLTSLPESFTVRGALPSLQLFNLEHNQLENMPQNIGVLASLTKLNLQHNRLINLPHSVARLTKLSKLQVGFNNLMKLSELHHVIAQIGTLRHCNASANAFLDVEDFMRGPTFDAGSHLFVANSLLEAGQPQLAVEEYDLALELDEKNKFQGDAYVGRAVSQRQLSRVAMLKAQQQNLAATEVYNRLQLEHTQTEISDLKAVVQKINASRFGPGKLKPNKIYRSKIDHDEELDMLAALKVDPWPGPQSGKEAAMQAALAGFQSYAGAYASTAKAAAASAALSSLVGVAACVHKIRITAEMVDEAELREVDLQARKGAMVAKTMQHDSAFDFFMSSTIQPSHKMASVYFNQGLLYEDMKRYSEGVNALVRGSEWHNGQYVPMVLQRAEVRHKLGQLTQAETDFRLAEEMHKTWAEVETIRANQKAEQRNDTNKEKMELEEKQTAERQKLEQKQKKQANKLTKVHDTAMNALFKDQNTVMDKLKLEHKRQQKVQREKMQAIPLEERNPDDVKQLLEAHHAAERDMAEEQSKAAESLVTEQSAEADDVAKQQEEETAKLAAKYAAQMDLLMPHTKTEKRLIFMLDQAEQLWNTQHTHNKETTEKALEVLLQKAETTTKKRRRVYVPLGAYPGDYYRGFDLQPPGECIRRRSHPDLVNRADQVPKRLFSAWPRDVTHHIQDEREVKQLRVAMKKEEKEHRAQIRDRTNDQLNERRERSQMAMVEAWQRQMDRLIEAERLRKLREMEQERQEKELMQYEETFQRWVASEIKRIEEEERKRLEMERLRREKEALQAKRQARRGRGAKIDAMKASKNPKSGKKKQKNEKADETRSVPSAPPQVPKFD